MSSVLASALPAACTSTVRLLTQACMALHTRLGPQLERCYSSNPSVLEAEGKAPEKLKRHLRDFAKLPWEVGMTRERAAQVLGSFLGVSDLEPAVVLKLNVDQIEGILRATTVQGDKELDKALFAYADAVTNKYFEEEVFYRGIVEFSNVCQNDCGYCGIRKHQHDVHRYTIPIPEVLEVAKWAFENKMGTLMLQSGELRTPQRMAYLTELIREIRKTTIAMDLETRGQNPKEVPENTSNLGLCVALSVGELEEDHYRQVYEAGARRYLLRIETSNPDLYHTLHPADMSWSRRVECLQALRRVGFQIGTGIMVGLPGQSLKDLAGDIVFFREMGANMIGMGPYITEPGTPVAEMWEQMFSHEDKKDHMRRMFDLTTRMNSLARITLGNANIAATTALQAIDPLGREIALRRGSNILMPILTPTKYREDYQLYEGKPCITDTADECRRCLNARISMIGKKLRDGVWGDPPNFVAPASGLDLTGKTASSGRSYSTYQQQHLIGTGGGRTPGGGPIPAVSPLSWGAQNFPARHHCRYATAARAAVEQKPPGSSMGSDVMRINIGVFGIMNAGKSTLMNRITRSETSIVDSTPGTTADVKTTLMELHDLGPVKLFDTAGIDEAGALGDKKRKKTLGALKESDVAVLVVDLAKMQQLPAGKLRDGLQWEKDLLQSAAKYNVVPLVLYNMKGCRDVGPLVERVKQELDPHNMTVSMVLDLHEGEGDISSKVADFLQEGVTRSQKRPAVRSVPEWALQQDAVVFLNIPMDAETPTMRLLRPQALVQEECIRYWATTVGYRMDLAAARSDDPTRVEAERQRFMRALAPVLKHEGPKLMITDSQAVDIVHPWTLDSSGTPLLPFTTFSICMIHRQSGGRLPLFVEGIKALNQLKPGERVLVAEACNHNRITATCNDIGMVQIPQKIERLCGKGVQLTHAFGREYPDIESGELKDIKLAIHCGACMIDHQKLRARISDMEEAGVPVTNYGIFLSYIQSPAALQRAMEPWGLRVDEEGTR